MMQNISNPRFSRHTIPFLTLQIPSDWQIWYHRRAVLEIHGAREFLDEELDYIAHVLEEDAKNYHAWSYRQWILMTVDDEPTWERELEFSKSRSLCVFLVYS